MSARARVPLFLVAAAGLAALLGLGVAGLPAFGDYHGPYGLVLNHVVLAQRHTTNVVAAVVFDYRGFDTLGEELILFAAVTGVALILREAREAEAKRIVDPVRGDPVRAKHSHRRRSFFLQRLHTLRRQFLISVPRCLDEAKSWKG